MTADAGQEQTVLAMPGLEADNLLAFIALLGLLRSLEISRPEWTPRAFWKGPPWVAQLYVSDAVHAQQVGYEANRGITNAAANFDVDQRKDVNFIVDDYRRYSVRTRSNETCASLAVSLTSESGRRQDRLAASPLVMMFGQGHQHFLERLAAIVRSGRISDDQIADTLFQPWNRSDETEGFRWDPEDDQRYAFRHGNPSKAGAALTVAGANRLAAMGFLSFSTVPRGHRIAAVGAVYDHSWNFVWPIWTMPASRSCIEGLLNHPDVLKGRAAKVRPLGVAQIFQAQRVANGKYMNVTRARPFEI